LRWQTAALTAPHPDAPSVISCVAVSVMCTGGAVRPFRQDRHFSAASSFQISVSRGRRTASSGRTENRCLVPANSFSEYAPEANPATGIVPLLGINPYLGSERRGRADGGAGGMTVRHPIFGELDGDAAQSAV
jgi:hypothetical protein